MPALTGVEEEKPVPLLLPLPNRIATSLPLLLATATSRWPSLLKLPTATASGRLMLVVYCVRAVKTPLPLFRRIWMPSWLVLLP